MSKRSNDNILSDNGLNHDIWSYVLLFFDDTPLIGALIDPQYECTMKCDPLDIPILSIDRIIDLLTVCKMFKSVIESENLLPLWQKIFIYNIGNKLNITKVDQLFDIHVNLLRHIIILNNILYKKGIYFNKNSFNPKTDVLNLCYHRNIEEFDNLKYRTFLINRQYREINKRNEINEKIKQYKKDINKMKSYIRTLRLSIKKRQQPVDK